MLRSQRPRRPVTTLAACLISAFLVSPALAAPPVSRTFELDPQATRVAFTLGATLHNVHGTLQARRGSLRWNPATGEAAGEIVLDATSAETGNASRDKDMHGKILESGKHPEIVWKVERVEGFPPEGVRSARVTLSGSLAIHGASHPLTVPAEVTLTDDRHAAATAAFKIPYVAWGMKDPSSFVLRVDKEIAVEVRAAGRLGG